MRDIRNYEWAVTTEHDCYGQPAPPDALVRWALYDASEDDPPIAVFTFREDAEMVCEALRRCIALQGLIDRLHDAWRREPPSYLHMEQSVIAAFAAVLDASTLSKRTAPAVTKEDDRVE